MIIYILKIQIDFIKTKGGNTIKIETITSLKTEQRGRIVFHKNRGRRGEGK